MTYTVRITVEVSATSEHQAYGFIRHALDQAKKAEIVYLDAEVTQSRPDEAEENPRERGDDDGVEYADPRDFMEERLQWD